MPTYDGVIRFVIPEIEHHQNRYARGLNGLVRKGCRWLDIGAGTRPHHGWTGADAEQLVARAEFAVGCDLAEDHLKRNRLLHAATVANASFLPFRDDSLTLVTANMVVEHLMDPALVFSEIFRVLVPGGRFAFVTPNRANPAVLTAHLLVPRPVRQRLASFTDGRQSEHIFPTFYRANTARQIRDVAAAIGFSVVELETFNSFPLIRRPWPLTAAEAMWIKALQRYAPRMTSNLYAVLQKDASE